MVALVQECIDGLPRNQNLVPEPLLKSDFSCKFMAIIPPEQHRELAIQASEQGGILNHLVSSSLGV